MLSNAEKQFISSAFAEVTQLTNREMALMIWAAREGGRGDIKDGASQFNTIIREVSIYLLEGD